MDSNDNLYAGDPKFVGEVSLLINTVLSLLLEHMKTLSASEEVQCGGIVYGCKKYWTNGTKIMTVQRCSINANVVPFF